MRGLFLFILFILFTVFTVFTVPGTVNTVNTDERSLHLPPGLSEFFYLVLAI